MIFVVLAAIAVVVALGMVGVVFAFRGTVEEGRR